MSKLWALTKVWWCAKVPVNTAGWNIIKSLNQTLKDHFGLLVETISMFQFHLDHICLTLFLLIFSILVGSVCYMHIYIYTRILWSICFSIYGTWSITKNPFRFTYIHCVLLLELPTFQHFPGETRAFCVAPNPGAVCCCKRAHLRWANGINDLGMDGYYSLLNNWCFMKVRLIMVHW